MIGSVLKQVSTSSLIGVAIACSGNVLISLALTVQKLAHRRQNDELVASRSTSTSQSSSRTATPPETSSTTRNTSTSQFDTPESSIPGYKAVPIVIIPEESTTSSQDVIVKPLEGNLPSIHARLAEQPKRGRSPSPGPIRIPKVYKLDVQLEEGEHGIDQDGEERAEEGVEEVQEGQYLRSKLWWAGLGLMISGEAGNFLSYGFAPASVVAPLGTVALIANCVFAPLILREKFHPRELVGMALAIIGAVTVVFSSNSSNPRLDPPSLLKLIISLPFLIYTLIHIVLLPILILLSRSSRFGGRYIAIDVGICALFGGYTVLSTKALSSLLGTIFLDCFRYWISWACVLVLVVTAMLQVKYLNKALMRFQSKEVIPTQFVFFSLAAIIGSAVLYQEFRDVTFTKFVNFAFGIATTFLGVHLLTSYSSPEAEDSPDSLPPTDPPRPTNPVRATSSASLNLLLSTERTPLLIPVSIPYANLLRNQSETPATAPAMIGRNRLMKRTSTSDFTPKVGMGQGGFLLMATTPPATVGVSMGRGRSGSRSNGGSFGAQNGSHGG